MNKRSLIHVAVIALLGLTAIVAVGLHLHGGDGAPVQERSGAQERTVPEPKEPERRSGPLGWLPGH